MVSLIYCVLLVYQVPLSFPYYPREWGVQAQYCSHARLEGGEILAKSAFLMDLRAGLLNKVPVCWFGSLYYYHRDWYIPSKVGLRGVIQSVRREYLFTENPVGSIQ